MKTQNNLLDKYYRGETSLEEEKKLKSKLPTSVENTSEKIVFEYYNIAASSPENLEDDILNKIYKHRKSTSLKKWIYRAVASAAIVLLLLSLYINLQTQQNNKMENNFFVMEQALFQISESIQPEIQDDMLVLWIDDNVEIIVN